mmetsp:Transcript_8197/g.30795  ORF Transcript_8197/g.30795 Transcript_8197/m.30795 type:complete len:211 (+) Transcript_8197:1119-1751(+)
MLLLVLIPLCTPSRDRLAVEHDDVEERVQQEDAIRSDGCRVEQHRLRRSIEAVADQAWLDHHQAVHHVLLDQDRLVVGGLVGATVEQLQELRPPQVEHELREDAELRRQPEAAGLVLAVLRELGSQPNEAAVQPAKDVRLLFRFRPEDGEARHENRGSFLVEAAAQAAQVVGIRVPQATHGRHAEAVSAGAMLVLGHELEHPALVCRKRL